MLFFGASIILLCLAAAAEGDTSPTWLDGAAGAALSRNLEMLTLAQLCARAREAGVPEGEVSAAANRGISCCANSNLKRKSAVIVLIAGKRNELWCELRVNDPLDEAQLRQRAHDVGGGERLAEYEFGELRGAVQAEVGPGEHLSVPAQVLDNAGGGKGFHQSNTSHEQQRKDAIIALILRYRYEFNVPGAEPAEPAEPVAQQQQQQQQQQMAVAAAAAVAQVNNTTHVAASPNYAAGGGSSGGGAAPMLDMGALSREKSTRDREERHHTERLQFEADQRREDRKDAERRERIDKEETDRRDRLAREDAERSVREREAHAMKMAEAEAKTQALKLAQLKLEHDIATLQHSAASPTVMAINPLAMAELAEPEPEPEPVVFAAGTFEAEHARPSAPPAQTAQEYWVRVQRGAGGLGLVIKTTVSSSVVLLLFSFANFPPLCATGRFEPA